jgi:glycosyltransferase involved in cell wall biosynthesis
MSHGTPVIATHVGGMDEWMVDGVTGLFVPSNDSAALARAIDRVLEDKTFARALGEAAKKRYEEFFRPDRHIDGLIGLCDTLAGKGR